MNVTLPTEVTHRTTVLNERAASLRAQADGLPELLAQTYRRRASELELEAWATELRAGGLADTIAA
jgi:hypothetical protein